jgi:hypothetical protein
MGFKENEIKKSCYIKKGSIAAELNREGSPTSLSNLLINEAATPKKTLYDATAEGDKVLTLDKPKSLMELSLEKELPKGYIKDAITIITQETSNNGKSICIVLEQKDAINLVQNNLSVYLNKDLQIASMEVLSETFIKNIKY